MRKTDTFLGKNGKKRKKCGAFLVRSFSSSLLVFRNFNRRERQERGEELATKAQRHKEKIDAD